ncbi:hypothetical protein Tco_1462880 [Tanacetum coccineum]
MIEAECLERMVVEIMRKEEDVLNIEKIKESDEKNTSTMSEYRLCKFANKETEVASFFPNIAYLRVGQQRRNRVRYDKNEEYLMREITNDAKAFATGNRALAALAVAPN